MSYTYDNADRPGTMTVAGQPTSTYSFDSANRLTGITQGTTSLSFSYDISNRRTSVTLPDGIVGTYTYDKTSRVTGITYNRGSTTLGDVSYTYDAAGRETSRGGSLARISLPAPVSTTTYNTNNQLTSWAGATLTYDGNGNLTNDGTNSFVWNARNQLASMNSGTNTFQYDAIGRRTGKSFSGATSSFLYDGLNPIQELQGSTVVANALSGGLDEVFLRTDSIGPRSFLTDRLGSTLALADSSGTVQTQYTYEPFGKTLASGQTSTNTAQFTAREDDPTGLYYYRGRYYQPTFGRFLSEDPIGFAAGDANLYAYVGDNPVSFTDPFGLKKEQDCSGRFHGGVGVINSAAAEAGLLLGAGAQASFGAGVFKDGCGFSGGAFGSLGTVLGPQSFPAPSPNQVPVVFGAYAGAGRGFYLTDAGKVSDLRGPFNTISYNWSLEIVPLGGSVQFGYSGNTHILSATIGGGEGASWSVYPTTTKTWWGR